MWIFERNHLHYAELQPCKEGTIPDREFSFFTTFFRQAYKDVISHCMFILSSKFTHRLKNIYLQILQERFAPEMCSLVIISAKLDRSLLFTCFAAHRNCGVEWAIITWFQGPAIREWCFWFLVAGACLASLMQNAGSIELMHLYPRQIYFEICK